MATFDSTQLSFFDPIEPEFSERIRRTNHKGETLYSLVDICAEFSDTVAARQFWQDTKKRLKQDGFDVSENILHISMTDKTGVRKQKTDVADAETCIRIVQSIPSPKAEPIRLWLAHLGFERLEEARTPGLGTQRARQRDLSALKRAGYNEHEAVKRLEVRIDGIDTFKILTATVARICKHPQYGQLIDTEYLYLFEQVSAGLKELFNTKSIRDSLPTLQLSYLKTAELTLEMVLRRSNQMTMPEILDAVQLVVKPLGEHLRAVSEYLGTHPVTGKLLLDDVAS